MLIVSQDKEEIVNFNVSFSVYITEKYDYDKNETIGYNIFVKHFEEVEFLGTYKTKERAREVLEEIIEFYEDTKQKMMLQNVHMLYAEKFDFVYYMPQQ